jgi:hypothetical protein
VPQGQVCFTGGHTQPQECSRGQEQKEPAGHDVGLVDPGGQNDPLPQGCAWLKPFMQKKPSGQIVGWLSPTIWQTCPSGHRIIAVARGGQ